jgi:hypothetical protein
LEKFDRQQMRAFLERALIALMLAGAAALPRV